MLDLAAGKRYRGQSVATNTQDIRRMNLDGSMQEIVVGTFGIVRNINVLPCELASDINGDGQVDFNDLNQMVNEFGMARP